MNRTVVASVFLLSLALITVIKYFVLSPPSANCDPTGHYSFVSDSSDNHKELDGYFWMDIEKESFSFIKLNMHNDSEDVQGTILPNRSQILANDKLPWGTGKNPVGTLFGPSGLMCDYIDWNDGVRWHRNDQ
jgi:hypothetical protein